MEECEVVEVVEEKKWLMLKINIYENEVVGSEISRRFLAPSNDPEASMRLLYPRHPDNTKLKNIIILSNSTSPIMTISTNSILYFLKFLTSWKKVRNVDHQTMMDVSSEGRFHQSSP